MSTSALARLLTLIALLTSGWALLVGTLAPFGSVGLAGFVVVAASGITSFAAVLVASRQPRHFITLGIACLLSLAHITLWSWVAVIAVSGGI
jgi:hypothetical protein